MSSGHWLSAADREDKALIAVVHHFEKCYHAVARNISRPDDVERNKKQVDLKFTLGGTCCVVEHTTIESYPGALEEGAFIRNELIPLLETIGANLPGSNIYYLAMPSLIGRVRLDMKKFENELRSWIPSAATGLKAPPPGSSKLESTSRKIQSVRFTLSRTSRNSDARRLRLTLLHPEDLEEHRARRIETALNQKLPKLEKARSNGDRTVLVLDDEDMQLSNLNLVGRALARAMKSQGNCPDFVLLADTVPTSDPVVFLSCLFRADHEWCQRLEADAEIDTSRTEVCLPNRQAN